MSVQMYKPKHRGPITVASILLVSLHKPRHRKDVTA